MDDPQPTRFSLLARLKDPGDERAWGEFLEIYTPVVYGFSRKCGLQDADATDVTQEVFRTVFRSIGGFQCERDRGSFRAWLMAVVRSRLGDYFATRGKHVRGTGDTATLAFLDGQPAADEQAAVWEKEYRKAVFEWAARRIRDDFQDSTWQAFWMTCVVGQNTKDVADALGMTTGAVYIAKCRVTARLKKEIQEVQEEE